MDGIALRQTKPKIAVVLLSSIGTIMVCDERGNRIPEYSGEYTRELRAKILADSPENALFYGPVGCKQMTKEEFRRRN
jgi:hypothetical protein